MKPEAIKSACSNCNLRELCLPIGLSPEEMIKIELMFAARRKVQRGTMLFGRGENFSNLYVIRTGFFKTIAGAEDTKNQVTGFQTAGEIVGLDGIVNDQHTCDAIALEDSEVCVLPFNRIEEFSREVKALQHHVNKLMSREIVRQHDVLFLLGSMDSEQRLAAFLLNLIHRMHLRGFSQSELILRMSRVEIGSYLGMQFETVSRIFSKLDADGIVDIKNRHIHVLDLEALRLIVNPKTGL
jgi:CRP/FNR family transcriptional regulator